MAQNNRAAKAVVKKINPASQHYGAASADNYRRTAIYGVFVNGEQVGWISGEDHGYMSSPDWTVCNLRHRPVKRFSSILTHLPFRAAKRWATEQDWEALNS